MQDYLNALRDVVNRIGNERENNGVQDQNNQVRTLTSSWRAHQQPHRQHLNHLPNPRNISFTIPDQQMDILHATSVIARSRVRQQLYHPEQQFAPCPRPPLWDEEMRAMMILWIARERRLFEWEMREMEHLYVDFTDEVQTEYEDQSSEAGSATAMSRPRQAQLAEVRQFIGRNNCSLN